MIPAMSLQQRHITLDCFEAMSSSESVWVDRMASTSTPLITTSVSFADSITRFPVSSLTCRGCAGEKIYIERHIKYDNGIAIEQQVNEGLPGQCHKSSLQRTSIRLRCAATDVTITKKAAEKVCKFIVKKIKISEGRGKGSRKCGNQNKLSHSTASKPLCNLRH